MSEQPAGSALPQGAEVSLLDLALVLTRNLRLLILLCAAAGLIAFVAAGAWTSSVGSYTAAAKALLPPSAPLGETYVALLKSETMADRMVRRFKLAQVYGTSPEQARATLAARTRITGARVLVVSVDDASAQLAADLANGYVEEARELARQFAISEAAQRRLHYERQVQSIAVELGRAKTQLQAERKYQEALLELLKRQYEFARVDEASTEIQLLDAADAANAASPAARGLRHRALIALAAMAATLMVCVVALFVREWWRREASTGEGARKIALIRESLRFRRR